MFTIKFILKLNQIKFIVDVLNEKIILIGTGGHAKSCIDVIEETKQFKINYLLEQKLGVN